MTIDGIFQYDRGQWCIKFTKSQIFRMRKEAKEENRSVSLILFFDELLELISKVEEEDAKV